MSMFTTFILLLALAGGLALWRFIWRRLGRFQSLVVLKGTPKPSRTRGEIHRELWEQKGALDRADQAVMEVGAWQDAAVQDTRQVVNDLLDAITAQRHLPDPPCEVEPPAAGPVPVRSVSMFASITPMAAGPVNRRGGR